MARTLESVGERWTMLIIRDVFFGVRRFGQLQADLGLAKNVLQVRLEHLVDDGILHRRRYQDRPARFEYVLTPKGRDLWPVLVALMQWGDTYERPAEGVPVRLEHMGCGGDREPTGRCGRCGQLLGPADIRPVPGLGAAPDHPLRALAGQQRDTGP